MGKLIGIYKITSKRKPERCYIGSAINLKHRWYQHLYYLRRQEHHSPKLQRHYNKYGESDLEFEILITCNREDLIPQNGTIEIEQFFIDLYRPWFNCCPRAGSRKGQKFSEETKRKMSIAAKNVSDEVRRGRSERMKGHIVSEETREKLRWAAAHPSETTRKKMSDDQKRRKKREAIERKNHI